MFIMIMHILLKMVKLLDSFVFFITLHNMCLMYWDYDYLFLLGVPLLPFMHNNCRYDTYSSPLSLSPSVRFLLSDILLADGSDRAIKLLIAELHFVSSSDAAIPEQNTDTRTIDRCRFTGYKQRTWNDGNFFIKRIKSEHSNSKRDGTGWTHTSHPRFEIWVLTWPIMTHFLKYCIRSRNKSRQSCHRGNVTIGHNPNRPNMHERPWFMYLLGSHEQSNRNQAIIDALTCHSCQIILTLQTLWKNLSRDVLPLFSVGWSYSELLSSHGSV